MPALESEVVTDQPVSNNDQSKPMSGPIIGIIYPPPEVKNIVDKTASFVARNGPEFEARIRQNELGNPKFNFLSPGDPYHAYYRHKVNEFREGKDTGPSVLTGIKQLSVTSAAQLKQQELLKQVAEQQFVPKDPPHEFEFIADPPSISALDLDIVKLTAQFVARNGRQFLTNLMNREQRNYQFDFLRPQHSLFQYFTKLLEQYTKVLIPPKDLISKLRNESGTGRAGMNLVLESVKYRANWQRHQEAQRRREEEKIEKERVAYAQIDWHDFVVVETVDYQPFETGNFPPPTTPEEVGARVLMEERMLEDDGDIEMQIESDDEDSQEAPAIGIPIKLSHMENRTGITMKNSAPIVTSGAKKDNTQVQDMDEASSDEETPTTNKIQPPVAPLLPPTHDKVVVKKYDPKAIQQKPQKPITTDEYLISPITGEKIPASKVAEHMRIGLLDPRWVEQRDKHTVEKINQDTVFAAGTAIEASLKQLAERRTDIFGVGDEETVIGKKLGEEETKKDDRVTWDGHTSSVEAATRAARANISLEDQIHQIHKVKGLLPDEEKEKIGPKPAINRSMVSSAPQTHPGPPKTMPPQPHHVVQQQQQHHHHHQHQQHQHQPPQQTQQQQQHGMQQPNPVMMMQMRPPPIIPPPFPVGGYMPTGGPPQISPAPPVMDMTITHVTMDEEPPNKKLRSEDNLIPEADFIGIHKSPITIQVQVPSVIDKSEWKLNGQTIAFTLALTDVVSNLKAKIQDETGMPPAKQKISYEGMFFKDSNTMAFYNLLTGATVHLQVKERGGRKK